MSGSTFQVVRTFALAVGSRAGRQHHRPRRAELPERARHLARRPAGPRAVEEGQHRARPVPRRPAARPSRRPCARSCPTSTWGRTPRTWRCAPTSTTATWPAPWPTARCGDYVFVATQGTNTVEVARRLRQPAADGDPRHRPRAAGPRAQRRRPQAVRPELPVALGQRLRRRAASSTPPRTPSPSSRRSPPWPPRSSRPPVLRGKRSSTTPPTAA